MFVLLLHRQAVVMTLANDLHTIRAHAGLWNSPGQVKGILLWTGAAVAPGLT